MENVVVNTCIREKYMILYKNTIQISTTACIICWKKGGNGKYVRNYSKRQADSKILRIEEFKFSFS